MLIVALYLLIFLVVITVLKYRSSYQMRMSQFLISVFCRAENNRLYLRRGVEVRPGFLGKWIEFTCVENENVDQMVHQMRQRFLKPCLEQKSLQFERNVMGQSDLLKEQLDIEQQIAKRRHSVNHERDLREQADVAAAVRESRSNLNDFSEEQEMSMQALGQNVNS